MPAITGFTKKRLWTKSAVVCLFLTFMVSSYATDLRRAKSSLDSTANPKNALSFDYGNIPLAFEPNRGQGAPDVRYLSHARGISLFMRDHDTTVVALTAADSLQSTSPAVVRLSFPGSDFNSKPRAFGQQEGISNYLLGPDPARWQTGIPNFAQVRYKNLYPGVDLVYYGNGQYLEQDFHIAAEADYRKIRVRLGGVSSLSADPATGMLRAQTERGDFLLSAPSIYQLGAGRKVAIAGGYVITGKNEFQFRVGPHDKRLPLVIDPVLSYSTYLAGSNVDIAAAITVDAKGSAYVTGYTFSGDFPVKNPEQAACNNSCSYSDVFVTKFNPTGTGLVYSTYVGGSNGDQGSAIAVDPAGNAVVVGLTWSYDFPLKNATTVVLGANSNHGFVFSLVPSGTKLNFSTYLGGVSSDAATGVAVDSVGRVYVGGYTSSSNFPVTPGHQIGPPPGGYYSNDIFLAQLGRYGKLAYSTLIGGSSNGYPGTFGTAPVSVKVDSAQEAILAGAAFAGFPTTPGSYQPNYPAANSGGSSGFIAKLNATGTAFVAATYLGGSSYDAISQIALDSAGNTYATGTAQSVDFPTTPGAFQTTHVQSGPVAFVTKIDPALSGLIYSTYFGGTQSAYGNGVSGTAIAVDANGNATIAGNTNQPDLPLLSPIQSQPPQNTYYYGGSAFLSILNAAGSSLEFSTYFSGSTGTSAQGVAIDAVGNPYLTGTTFDTDLPTTQGAFQTSPPPTGNPQHAFVTKFLLGTPNAAVCLSTGSIFFWSRAGNPSLSEPLSVTNCGTVDLLISNIGISNPVFTVTSAGCVKVLPGATCSLKLKYTPLAGADSDTGTLQFVDNAPIPTQTVTLNGYVDRPTINIYYYGLGFSDQIVGITSSPVYLPVYTQGDLPLHITSVVATGDFAGVNHCPKALQPNSGICYIGATFTPSAVGPATGSLLVYDDAPGSPQVVQLSGNGIATYPTPVVTFTYPNSALVGSGPVKVTIDGIDIFAATTVLLNGKPYSGTVKHFTGGLEVTLGSNFFTTIRSLTLQVVNPAPGGPSAPLEFNVYKQTPLSASDVVFEPFTRKFYASIPASSAANPNTLVTIDASTGQVGSPIAIGNDPGALGLSDDGQTLYVALNGDHSVVPFNIGTQLVGAAIPLGVDPQRGPLTATDLQVQPGNPGNVVATLGAGYNGADGVALISNGAVVSEFLNEPPNNVAVGGTRFIGNSDVYGWQNAYYATGMLHFVISGNELLEAPGFSGPYGLGAFATDGKNLFDVNGQVYDPATGTLVGTLTSSGVAIFRDPSSGRIFLAQSGGFAIFDSTTFAQVGFAGGPSAATLRLGQWGRNGLYDLVPNSSGYDLAQMRSNFFNSSPGPNPTPSVLSLDPSPVSSKGPNFVLTVKGSQFVPGAVVQWNGTDRTTQWIDASTLAADIPAADIALPGTATLSVINPGPGGGKSNRAPLTIQ
jgi:Beta-propeller repeat